MESCLFELDRLNVGATSSVEPSHEDHHNRKMAACWCWCGGVPGLGEAGRSVLFSFTSSTMVIYQVLQPGEPGEPAERCSPSPEWPRPVLEKSL